MSSGSGPNPLRPYYIPPSQEYTLEALHASADRVFSPSSRAATTASYATSVSSPSSSSVFNTTARDFLPDLTDYSDSFDGSGPSPREIISNLAVRASMRYTFQGISQPFDVAITNLQCQYIPKKEKKVLKLEPNHAHGERRRGRTRRPYGEEGLGEFNDASESDEEPNYFTTNTSEPGSPSLRATSSKSRRMTDRAGYVIDTPDVEEIRPPWEIKVYKQGHVWEVIKALWAKEGMWGIWKGQNANFIHWFLSSTIESWTSSLLSAVLSLPEPAELADSPFPLTSIGVAVAASALTALLLSPLDIIRTRLMITPSTDTPRNILPHLRSLPTYTCPPSLLLPTALTATIPSFILHGKPFFIRRYLGIDPLGSPTTFSFFSFLGTLTSRFFRLPLETVLRRGQVEITNPKRTIVPVGRYAGVFGTMWLIVKEEEGGLGGLEGLFRGWRMEFWPELALAVLSMVGISAGGSEAGEGF